MPEPSDKHLQLGVDLTKDDRTELTDEAKNALWDDACTVDEYGRQLAELADADPLEIWELARLRQERGF
jgi:hypothetical protein